MELQQHFFPGTIIAVYSSSLYSVTMNHLHLMTCDFKVYEDYWTDLKFKYNQLPVPRLHLFSCLSLFHHPLLFFRRPSQASFFIVFSKSCWLSTFLSIIYHFWRHHSNILESFPKMVSLYPCCVSNDCFFKFLSSFHTVSTEYINYFAY